MTAKVIQRMSLAKASVVVFVAVALLTTLFMVKLSQGEALPASPQDNSKVPHYFGPWPNWALSPLTLPDVTVTINGNGSGAKATATVGGNGAVTGVSITDPGSGYSAATVAFSGAGTNAAARAVVTASGVVTGVTVTAGGAGYTAPVVTIAGGGATANATATAYGGVDAVTLSDPGTGYKFPTVDFDAPDDPNGTQALAHATFDTVTGAIKTIVIDEPGSGYESAPGILIRDGTIMDPIINGGAGATATATLKIVSVGLDTFGAGYTSAPTVTIGAGAGAGSGATATASVDAGGVTGITLTSAGSGYVTGGGIKKFQDTLPGLCDPASLAGCPTGDGAKFIPLGVPVVKPYDDPNGDQINADEYEIALIQYRTQFNSDLPPTLVRGYVQLETDDFVDAHPGISQHYPLMTANVDPTQPDTPVLIGGQPAYGVTSPQWLGPTLAATKNRPVRVVFHNLLPLDQAGDLFLPVDSTLMGSGKGPVMPMVDPVDEGTVMDGVRNPVCNEYPKPIECFADNRQTLHLHGGISPWISDGTPHQWITPAGEDTDWPEGVSVRAVPDMTDVDTGPRDGIQTFFYTNQQSARLMFYHDHAWGTTRLNVYAGAAAGYLISDDTEKALVDSGTIPGAGDTIPLIVQDRTFVPGDEQMYDVTDGPGGPILTYGQDPTWDKARWGGKGSLWIHHVYMPAQNPGDPGGMSAYGRWMYGPWFWPPAAETKYGPIANPYYDPNCDLDDPATWTYQTDPYCEPPQIPGTPNISAGMEQFNDTPVVNGVAYPEVTLQPKTYRFRMLNAANDRFFNFQWYVADPSTGTRSEVALNPAELAAAQTDPVAFPTPVQNASTAGPDWIHIGSEGGFLPAPAVVDGQQPTTWVTDPTRFDVGNVDLHSLLLAPAERADVIVDFSKFAGKTLILYNDAPAAFPARVPSYDYYTGGPDLSPNGAPTVLPGYGPNTRTIMRVTIAAGAAAPAFNLTRLRTAFGHKADGSGVFESGQHPIIVGQAAYNSAYGTSFAGSSNCNPIPNDPNPAFQICDGLVRVNDTMTFGFNTLKKQTTKTTIPLQPKAIHDEMNATTFDEFGRMQANLGIEAQPPTPGKQNGTFYPFVNPATEIIDGTNLPKNNVTYDTNGDPVSDVEIAPITSAKDGTQIWRVTHNGVDTHPIHFHLYDVQLLNRVTWDNIVIPTEPGELGWKDTVRIAPLEDTIVALRPIVPEVPWEVPNSIRNLNPMDPTGSTNLFNSVDVQGNPTAPITNQLVNFGGEYVWHCHILSHEEMDMMRPQTLAMPPVTPDGLSVAIVADHVDLTFEDNSITETSFLVQRSTDGTTWDDAGTIEVPLDQPNDHRTRTFTDAAAYDPLLVYQYRVVARNTVGYGGDYPGMTVQSVSEPVLTGPAPAAPTGLTATLQAGPEVALSFTDNATDETGFTVQRADNGGAWTDLTTLPPNSDVDPTVTGTVTYTDTTVTTGNTYDYRVRADKGAAGSLWSNVASVDVSAVPGAPTGLTATLQVGPQVRLDFIDNATDETGFTIERADNGGAWVEIAGRGAHIGTGAAFYTDTSITPGNTYVYRVRANNGSVITSAWSNEVTIIVPAAPEPPSGLTASLVAGPQVRLDFTDNATFETGFTIERAANGGAWAPLTTLPANTAGDPTVTGAMTYTDGTVAPGNSYDYRVRADNGPIISSVWSNTATIVVPVTAPSALTARQLPGLQISVTWADNSANESGFTLQRSVNGGGFTTLVALPANTVSFIDAPATPGTTYAYQIRAFNASGPSAWAGPVSVAVPSLPLVPTGLARTIARTGAGPDTVNLTWVYNATNAAGFTLQRASNSAFTAGLVTFPIGGTARAFTTAVAHGGTYYYRIQAYNLSGTSAWSGTVSVTTEPLTPTNFRSIARTRTSITLAWNDISSNETGYQIQRRRVGAARWTTEVTTAANRTQYKDTGRGPNTRFDYRIRGRNGVGDSAWSRTIRVATRR